MNIHTSDEPVESETVASPEESDAAEAAEESTEPTADEAE